MKRRASLLERVIELGYPAREARALIIAGRVLVNGERETRAGYQPALEAPIEVRPSRRYPSRAAEKLSGAIEDLHPEIAARPCLDLGAAHGGFTAVLLEYGARRVYAVDVSYGILAFELRQDPRVVALERLHVRDLRPEHFAIEDLNQAPGLFIVCDLSFISIRHALQAMKRLHAESKASCAWRGLFLVKPQFEDSAATEGGVLRDAARREEAIVAVIAAAEQLGFRLLGRAKSRLSGASGNVEEFLHLEIGGDQTTMVSSRPGPTEMN